MAHILFTHSIYFPAILHYGRILGNSNLMVVNMESKWGSKAASTSASTSDGDTSNLSDENEKIEYANRLQRVAAQVYSFAGLCSHEVSSQALAEAVSLSPDLQSSGARFQSFDSNNSGQELPTFVNKHKISRRTLHQLVTFFRPFNAELSRIIGQDLSHWNNVTSFEAVHGRLMDVETIEIDSNTSFSGTVAEVSPGLGLGSTPGALRINVSQAQSSGVHSHDVDWFDEERKEALRQHLLQEEAQLEEAEEDRDGAGEGREGCLLVYLCADQRRFLDVSRYVDVPIAVCVSVLYHH
jgi:hypothetical protein